MRTDKRRLPPHHVFIWSKECLVVERGRAVVSTQFLSRPRFESMSRDHHDWKFSWCSRSLPTNTGTVIWNRPLPLPSKRSVHFHPVPFLSFPFLSFRSYTASTSRPSDFNVTFNFWRWHTSAVLIRVCLTTFKVCEYKFGNSRFKNRHSWVIQYFYNLKIKICCAVWVRNLVFNFGGGT